MAAGPGVAPSGALRLASALKASLAQPANFGPSRAAAKAVADACDVYSTVARAWVARLRRKVGDDAMASRWAAASTPRQRVSSPHIVSMLRPPPSDSGTAFHPSGKSPGWNTAALARAVWG